MSKYGSYEVPENADDLSNMARPGMDICKFVVEWGTVGSSHVFTQAIQNSTMSDEMKGVAFEILGNLQQSLKLIRKDGSCGCKIE